MTSRELIYKIEELLAIINANTDLLSILSDFTIRGADLLDNFSRAVDYNDSGTVFTHVNRAKEKLLKNLDEIKNVKPSVISVKIKDLERSLEKFSGGTNIVLQLKKELVGVLNEFITSYDTFLQSRKDSDALLMLTSAKSAYFSLQSSFDLLSVINSDIQNISYTDLPDYEVISIYINMDLSLGEFADKLNAINVIYKELIPLFKISETDFPLRIVKIESGSTWMKLVGNLKVIKCISYLVVESAKYLYRNFTTEGKLTVIPLKTEAINQIFNLRVKLEEANINTDEMDNEISKASVKLSKEVTKLLKGVPEISINSNTFSVGESNKRKFLEASSQFLLESRIESKTNDEDIDLTNQ